MKKLEDTTVHNKIDWISYKLKKETFFVWTWSSIPTYTSNLFSFWPDIIYSNLKIFYCWSIYRIFYYLSVKDIIWVYGRGDLSWCLLNLFAPRSRQFNMRNARHLFSFSPSVCSMEWYNWVRAANLGCSMISRKLQQNEKKASISSI